MPIEVLIADDDPLLRALLEHRLAGSGYRVRAVENGRAALDEADRQPPDVLVLDAMMPVMDGFETLRRLKNNATLQGVAVLMLTALRQPEHAVNALKLGAADFLTKPFSPDELVARLYRLREVQKIAS